MGWRQNPPPHLKRRADKIPQHKNSQSKRPPHPPGRETTLKIFSTGHPQQTLPNHPSAHCRSETQRCNFPPHNPASRLQAFQKGQKETNDPPTETGQRNSQEHTRAPATVATHRTREKMAENISSEETTARGRANHPLPPKSSTIMIQTKLLATHRP